jgi:1,4-alpha-glucan branching enzyme
MYTFDPTTGCSYFEFDASPHEPVFLVGDFNLWQLSALGMSYRDGKWRLSVRLPCGRHAYAFQLRDGFYGGGVAEVPTCFRLMTDDWLGCAARNWTCDRHFWKWN